MPERPPISGTGTILEEREEGRLYLAEMPNGFRTLAVQTRDVPPPPENPVGRNVELAFSPYDMSHGRIVDWR